LYYLAKKDNDLSFSSSNPPEYYCNLFSIGCFT
jgi:hypothetical protein